MAQRRTPGGQEENNVPEREVLSQNLESNIETETTGQQILEIPPRRTFEDLYNKSEEESTNVSSNDPNISGNDDGTLTVEPSTFITRVKSGIQTVVSFFKNSLARKKRCPYCFNMVSERDVRQVQAQDRRVENNSNERINIKSTHKINCPRCKRDLPRDFFLSNARNIAIVGGVSSGKSTYITMLIHLLQNQNSIINDLHISTDIVNEGGKQLFKENFKSLEASRCISATSTLNQPILLRIRSGKKSTKSLYVTILDAKGEEFKSVDDILVGLPSLYHADAVLLLLNPFDLRNIFQEAKNLDGGRGRYGWFEDQKKNDVYEIIENFYDVYLNRNLVKPGKRIKIPVVMGLTRADELEKVAEIDLYEDLEEDFHDLEYLENEMQDVSEELLDFLEESEARLPNLTGKLFENLSFFPISAMGCRSNDGKIYERAMNPKGVLLPFLWLLKQTKFNFK